MTKQIQCRECGEPVVESLGSVRLANDTAVTLEGVRVRTCSNGHRETATPHAVSAHNLAVAAIVAKPWSLAPGEIRMLRVHAGLSGRRFAAILGVTPETVSRWENGKMGVAPVADRAIRLVAMHEATPPMSLDALAEVDPARSEPLEVTLRWDGSRWNRVAEEAAA